MNIFFLVILNDEKPLRFCHRFLMVTCRAVGMHCRGACSRTIFRPESTEIGNEERQSYLLIVE